MFVVGVLKYGERVWALMRADSCGSSSLSATSYKKDFRTDGAHHRRWYYEGHGIIKPLAVAYTLLDVPKQMFEGPTRYVKAINPRARPYKGVFMMDVVGLQLSMMFDLLYTKAAVVHTWLGLFIRVISLAFTVTALWLFFTLSDQDGYSRVDVSVTKVLLIGAVILETMSLLRAVFSKWTAVLLFESACHDPLLRYHHELSACGAFANLVGFAIVKVEFYGKAAMQLLLRSKTYWSGCCMQQHSFFKLCKHTTGSKIAEMIGREDLWDSMFYSWTTHAPEFIIERVVRVLGTPTDSGSTHVTESHGLNALRRSGMKELMQLLTRTESEGEGERLTMRLELDESILVWHIATHVYIQWLREDYTVHDDYSFRLRGAVEVLSNYMFFLLATRPYMLPYPVTRERYVQLCYDTRTSLNLCSTFHLLRAIELQMEALMREDPFIPTPDMSPQPAPRSINPTLDIGCQLAANLIHRDNDLNVTLDMINGVWVEMLCYTAYRCNENFHAKHLSGGADIMTVVALLMIYKSRDFF
ncbi:hypothetical protein BAE44_0019787 [Dichanthelium oligosanthes]|uniref:DUF4220 domain-containing protein n=1 Tax=Dichanthelium oligosanthes TaxID=888268 RepID=A0A1E5V2C3_9POAL|nr:hypothetical protein BAE44_0019787 [Dichanthelium oligosanthes]